MATAGHNLLKDRNFSLLFWGETVSNLGDQFTFIALPWLILKLTNDPLALGIVLGLAGIPRALFMLFGGALVDRFSPKRVMLLSNLVRLINVALLAVIILTGVVNIWIVYVYALIFGTADAFFMPSQTTMVTRLAKPEDLEQANTYVMGSAQISQFIGPALVGVLIGWFDRSNESLTGIGLAMVFDALTFMVSLLTLMAIKSPVTTQSGATGQSIMSSIAAGLRYAWSNVGLRSVLCLAAAINFILVGPFIIGIPVVMQQMASQGATGYGIIMSAYGIGTLIGIVLVTVLTKISPAFRKPVTLVFLTSVIGIILAAMSFAESILVFAALSFMMALLSGFVSISFITLIQRQVPMEMIGRIMSIVVLFSIGLVPLSEIVAGVVVKMGASPMFLVAGILFFAISVATLMVPEVKRLGMAQPVPVLNSDSAS
jgi:MFS family permease